MRMLRHDAGGGQETTLSFGVALHMQKDSPNAACLGIAIRCKHHIYNTESSPESSPEPIPDFITSR